MKGVLYYIDNTINDMIYIGISYSGLEVRWRRHLNKAKTGTSKLYKAMRELGVSNFNIHLIREYEQGDLEKAETYYITKYNTVNCGYNSTYGGEVHNIISEDRYEKILHDIQFGDKSIVDIASQNKVSMEYIKRVAHNEGFELNNTILNNVNNKPIAVICIDINANYIKEFKSMQEAYSWVKEKLAKSIREGHFYYQVKYAINTGNIAYSHFWFKKEHFDTRIANEDILMVSSKYEGTHRKLCDSGLRYKGNTIYNVEKSIKQCGTTTYNVKSDKKPYGDRQVPENIHIKYPLEKEQLAQLYPKYTVNSIAKRAGLSYTTVNKHLKLFGIK